MTTNKIALPLVVTLNLALTACFQLVTLHLLGLGEAMDAVLAAQTVPVVAASVLTTAFGKQLIAFFSDASDISGQVVLPVALYTGFAVLLFAASVASASAHWMPLVFSGFTGDSLTQSIELGYVFNAGLALQLVVVVLNAYWHSRQEYLRVEIAALGANAMAIMLLVPFMSHFGLIGVAIGTVVRTSFNLAFVIVRVPLTKQLKLSPTLYKPLMIGFRGALGATAIFKIAPVIDNALVSHAGPGAVSVLGLFQQIYGMAILFVERLVAPQVISKAAGAKDAVTLADVGVWYKRTLLRVLVGATLSSILLVTLLPNLVAIMSKNPTHIDVALVATWFGLYLMGAVVGSQSANFLFGLKKSEVVLRVAALTFLFSLVIRVFGLLWWGFFGVVAGICLFQLINGILLYRATQPYVLESKGS